MGVPDGLGVRGATLWDALGQSAGSPAGELALEACRSADRLDELDRIIAGKGVLNLLSFRLNLDLEDEAGDRQVNVRVEFSHVLAEARQQQTTFKQILVALGAEKAKAATQSKGTALDELAKRRAGTKPAARRSRAPASRERRT